MSLLVVTGPPGVGKSTVAALVADRLPRSVLVEGDAFFAFVRQGAIEPWRPESHEQNQIVIEAAAVATGRFAASGYPTVYDGVVGPWFLDAFLAGTGLDTLDYAMLLPSVDVCVERVMTRVGHEFRDEAAARKMHLEFTNAVVDARHVVDNHDDAEAAADEVMARWERGDLRV